MTDDIVARLREFDADLTKEIADGEHGEEGYLWVIPFDCILQAADEIERLRAEVCLLRSSVCIGAPSRTTVGWSCFKEATDGSR